MTGFGMNPAFDWRRFGGETLQDIGVGLTQSPTIWGGIGRAAQIGQEKQPYRDQQERIRKEDEAKQQEIIKQQELRTKYADFFEEQGQGDWARAVADELVSPADAFGAWMQGKAPEAPVKGVEINGQLVNPITGETLGDYRTPDQMGGAGSTEYGLTPQWFQMDDGSYGFGVIGKDGSFKPVETPEGATMLDPRTLATERAVGSTVGQGQGKAITAAPSQITNAGMAKGLIEEIRNHPELPWATGRSAAFGMNDPRINPQRAAFQDLVEQAKGGAFLTAIQQLQGLGALSNAEGAAATAAINRINTAVEKADFLKALADYEALVDRGMAKAKAILQSQGLNDMGLPGGGNVTSTGVPWSYEP
jgi:hypothetical protein